MRVQRAFAVAVIGFAARTSSAQPIPDGPPDQPAPAPPPTEPTPAPGLPTVDELADYVNHLEQRIAKLESETAGYHTVRQQVASLLPLTRYLTVYLDVGAFVVGGNGSGIRSDFLHTQYPEYRDSIAGQWVFMGDPFSTMINTLGEPADTATSRSVPTDTVNSSGRASFIVNTLALAIGKDLWHGVSVSALAHFLPRPGPDILDLPFAHVDFRPSDKIELVIGAGKIDSVLGIEYRSQDAPRRIGITPSLICRYTCGRPIGIDARWIRGPLSASAAITNGDNFEERFEPRSELRSSRYPSASGHLQWTFPIGQGLELGISGAYGPQDGQPNSKIRQWHYGFDARLLDLEGWNATAEFVQGKQLGATSAMPGVPSTPCDVAECLDYKGAYLLVDRRVTPWLNPYARVDWRDATHRDGAHFLYESHSLRATLGVQLSMTSRIRAKAEYNFNHEIGVPSFPHDVLTTSVVVSTD